MELYASESTCTYAKLCVGLHAMRSRHVIKYSSKYIFFYFSVFLLTHFLSFVLVGCVAGILNESLRGSHISCGVFSARGKIAVLIGSFCNIFRMSIYERFSGDIFMIDFFCLKIYYRIVKVKSKLAFESESGFKRVPLNAFFSSFSRTFSRKCDRKNQPLKIF